MDRASSTHFKRSLPSSQNGDAPEEHYQHSNSSSVPSMNIPWDIEVTPQQRDKQNFSASRKHGRDNKKPYHSSRSQVRQENNQHNNRENPRSGPPAPKRFKHSNDNDQQFGKSEAMKLSLPSSVETDATRIANRLKQINIVYSSPYYAKYLELVPKDSRTYELRNSLHPTTPNHRGVYSKRQWEGHFNAWRRRLNFYQDTMTELKLSEAEIVGVTAALEATTQPQTDFFMMLAQPHTATNAATQALVEKGIITPKILTSRQQKQLDREHGTSVSVGEDDENLTNAVSDAGDQYDNTQADIDPSTCYDSIDEGEIGDEALEEALRLAEAME